MVNSFRHPAVPLAALLCAALGNPAPAFSSTDRQRTAAYTIAYGQQLTGAIAASGMVNVYSFTGAAGETVALLNAKTSGDGWAKAELFGPDGTGLASQYGSYSVRFAVKLLKTGTHSIRISEGFRGDGTYAYTLSLQRVAPPGPTATSVAFGQSVTGRINATLDAFFFLGAPGGKVTAKVTKTGGDGWAMAELYGPNGALLKSSYGSSSVTLDVSLTATGAHTILVLEGFRAVASYDYRLDLQCLGECQTPVANQPLRFVPVSPCRVADTRNASGTFGGPVLAGGTSRSFPVPQSSCGIPASAQAYSLNVTVVPRSPLGFLTLWPTGQAQPWVSTLNSPSGKIVANAALVPAGDSGSVNVYVTDPADVVLDINGYFAPVDTPGGLLFYPVQPCRISDTRNPAGAFGGPVMNGGSSRTVPVPSSLCGIPSTAQAYSLNATVVPQGGLGYLTLWPAGQSRPLVSTLNSPDGSITANAAIVPAGDAGAVSLYVTDWTDVVLDVNGYFAAPGGAGLNLYTATPCRISDTRNAVGTFGGPVMEGGSQRTYPVNVSACAIPATAQAYALNATVVPSQALGFLTLWPTGGTQPFVSTLNSPLGLILANAALVPAGANGAISAYVTDRTHLILDINGYFAP